MDLSDEDVRTLVARVQAREVPAAELVAAALSRLNQVPDSVCGFVATDPERALHEARMVDQRLDRGETVGPLAGIPIGVKDLEDAAGYRTTFGDPALAAAAPAERDSLQVARLRTAGAIVLGKTNTSQYGWKAETDNPLFGATGNPWAPNRVAGGSSGGSAAAVAEGIVPLATGSDGGGSIRIPAACCNVPGFKPTTGVVPTADSAPPEWGSLSTRGILASRFADVAYALDVVAGTSHRDEYAVPALGSFSAASSTPSLAGVRVAWAPTLGYAEASDPISARCEATVQMMEREGAHIDRIETVFDRDPGSTWTTLVAPRILRSASQTVGNWEERFDPGLVRWLERARLMKVEEYLAAQEDRHTLVLQLAEVWNRFDLLACPVTALPPPRLSSDVTSVPDWVRFTYPFNLTTNPAVSVPVGFVEVEGQDLPIGLQLVAPRFADLALMRAAAALEQLVRDPGASLLGSNASASTGSCHRSLNGGDAS